jgi:glucose-1-phosphate thymidylyltransferase
LPAAGSGSRIQPLAFSKELLPVGSRSDGDIERPRAVSEYLIERMLLAGVDKLCFVISPGKTDILDYYGAAIEGAPICYVVQPEPRGLCDAIFRSLTFINKDEEAVVGLPDTVWFPRDGLCELKKEFSFLLFPVARPSLFDTVMLNGDGTIQAIDVKCAHPRTEWIWGAFKIKGSILGELYRLWCARERRDEYIGTLVNAYLADGGRAYGVKAGLAYVDVGTVNGYHEAIKLLARESNSFAASAATQTNRKFRSDA